MKTMTTTTNMTSRRTQPKSPRTIKSFSRMIITRTAPKQANLLTLLTRNVPVRRNTTDLSREKTIIRTKKEKSIFLECKKALMKLKLSTIKKKAIHMTTMRERAITANTATTIRTMKITFTQETDTTNSRITIKTVILTIIKDIKVTLAIMVRDSTLQMCRMRKLEKMKTEDTTKKEENVRIETTGKQTRGIEMRSKVKGEENTRKAEEGSRDSRSRTTIMSIITITLIMNTTKIEITILQVTIKTTMKRFLVEKALRRARIFITVIATEETKETSITGIIITK
mmetsp:Transcript_41046/g.42916  ORF Transcript_41046/g.42916 Transcript_41046/m.42916 type:complete len:284 (-) Transcript_41046:989-1840(-)